MPWSGVEPHDRVDPGEHAVHLEGDSEASWLGAAIEPAPLPRTAMRGSRTAAGAGIVCTGGSTSPGDDQPTGDSAEAIRASAPRAAHRLRHAPAPGGVVARLERACHPRDQRVRRLSVGRAMASERGQVTIEWTGVVLSSHSPWRRWRLRCRGWTAVAWAGRRRACSPDRWPARPRAAPRRCSGTSARRQRCEGALDRVLGLPTLPLRARTSARGRRGDAAGSGPRSRQRVPEPAWVPDWDSPLRAVRLRRVAVACGVLLAGAGLGFVARDLAGARAVSRRDRVGRGGGGRARSRGGTAPRGRRPPRELTMPSVVAA